MTASPQQTPYMIRLAKNADELAGAARVRWAVFVEEQQIVPDDRDDKEEIALHFVAMQGEGAEGVTGTVRLWETDQPDHWWLSRFAVDKTHRGRGIGTRLIGFSLATILARGAKGCRAEVQSQNIKLFKACGWRVLKDDLVIHGFDHALMEADLSVVPAAGDLDAGWSRPSHM